MGERMVNINIVGGFTAFELLAFLTSIGLLGLAYLALINI